MPFIFVGLSGKKNAWKAVTRNEGAEFEPFSKERWNWWTGRLSTAGNGQS